MKMLGQSVQTFVYCYFVLCYLSSSPEKERMRKEERAESLQVTSDQVQYKSASVAAVGSVPLYQYRLNQCSLHK